jgi:hypothetical protein
MHDRRAIVLYRAKTSQADFQVISGPDPDATGASDCHARDLALHTSSVILSNAAQGHRLLLRPASECDAATATQAGFHAFRRQ